MVQGMAKELKNLLIYKIHDREFFCCASDYFHGRLIDIGCRIKPYKDRLANYVTEHVGVDHEETFHLNLGLIIQDAAYLPDKVDRSEQWTWVYLVVARKK